MATPDNQNQNPETASLQEEGEKVTGGSESTETQNQKENNVNDKSAGGEISPYEESKKEDMTGYNEHPDQDKVGGG